MCAHWIRISNSPNVSDDSALTRSRIFAYLDAVARHRITIPQHVELFQLVHRFQSDESCPKITVENMSEPEKAIARRYVNSSMNDPLDSKVLSRYQTSAEAFFYGLVAFRTEILPHFATLMNMDRRLSEVLMADHVAAETFLIRSYLGIQAGLGVDITSAEAMGVSWQFYVQLFGERLVKDCSVRQEYALEDWWLLMNFLIYFTYIIEYVRYDKYCPHHQPTPQINKLDNEFSCFISVIGPLLDVMPMTHAQSHHTQILKKSSSTNTLYLHLTHLLKVISRCCRVALSVVHCSICRYIISKTEPTLFGIRWMYFLFFFIKEETEEKELTRYLYTYKTADPFLSLILILYKHQCLTNIVPVFLLTINSRASFSLFLRSPI